MATENLFEIAGFLRCHLVLGAEDREFFWFSEPINVAHLLKYVSAHFNNGTVVHGKTELYAGRCTGYLPGMLNKLK